MAGAAFTLLASTDDARASAGCAAFSGTINGAGTIISGTDTSGLIATFTAGDVIHLSHTGTSNFWGLFTNTFSHEFLDYPPPYVISDYTVTAGDLITYGTLRFALATLGGNGGDTLTVSCTSVAGPSTSSAPNGNNVAGSLHQSTQYVTHQITVSSIATITNAIESGIQGQFSGAAGGISLNSGGGAATAANPSDPAHPGLTGYGVSRRQALTMLAQAAQSMVTRSDATPFPRARDDGAPHKEALALGPSAMSIGANRPYGIFMSGSYSGIGSSQAGGQFSGSVQTYTGGADYKFSPNLLAGVALGYETSAIDTTYNLGSLKGNGFTIMPYVAWQQDNLQWDAMLGGGSLGYHIAQNTNTPATGSYSAQRLSFKTNFTAHYTAGGFNLSPTVGLLSAVEFDNGYIDSTGVAQSRSSVRILRPSAGGEIGYDWAVLQTTFILSPYAKALLQYDILQSGRAVMIDGTLASETTLTGVLGGGVRARLTDYLSAMVEATYNTVGAPTISQWVATGEIRLDLPF